MNEDEIAERIYDVLGSSRFAKWYADSGQFGAHVCGDLVDGERVPKAVIMEQIKKMFLTK